MASTGSNDIGVEAAASEAISSTPDDADALRIAWWNTGLTPPAGPIKREEPYRVTVCGVISSLLRDAADIVVLGESSPQDVAAIKAAIGTSFRDLADTENDSRLAVLLDSQRLKVLDTTSLTFQLVNKSLKRAWRLQLLDRAREFPFFLYACHLHSQLYGQADERFQAAASIRADFIKLRELNTPCPIVIIGDFNEEPFSGTMTSGLYGSRDRSLVIDKSVLLYNPFWRRLGEQQHIAQQLERRIAAGTHYYSGSQFTRWFTLDQALVSSEFLAEGPWILDEEASGIVHHPELLTDKGRIMRPFDHLPIVVSFTLQEGQG